MTAIEQMAKALERGFYHIKARGYASHDLEYEIESALTAYEEWKKTHVVVKRNRIVSLPDGSTRCNMCGHILTEQEE